MIENERRGFSDEEIFQQHLIYYSNYNRTIRVQCSNESSIENRECTIVHFLYISAYSKRTANREKEERRKKKQDNLRVNFVDAIKTIG